MATRTRKHPNMQRPARRILNDIRSVCLEHYRNGQLSTAGNRALKRLWRELEHLRGRRFGALDVRGLKIRLQRPDLTPVMQQVLTAPQRTVAGILSRLNRIGH